MARRRSSFKSNATPQEKEAQREYERNKKKQQRAIETPQQREARLQKMRDYRAEVFGSTERGRDKSPANCYSREYDRNQKRIQRERETSQQREERLQSAREYMSTYKHKATPKEKEAIRQKMAVSRANRTEEQVAKDREAARQRMAKVRSRMTVDERNEEKDKKRERRMGEPNWRSQEYDRMADLAWEERDRKLASSKWRENDYGVLEAIDPDSLEWDCPAGPDCTCHFSRTCSKCRRSFYGCQALCPGIKCTEREEQGTTDDPKPSTSGEVYAPKVDIPGEMCEYDQIRQKNIEERERKFQELGLNEATTTLSNSMKLTKKVKTSQKEVAAGKK